MIILKQRTWVFVSNYYVYLWNLSTLGKIVWEKNVLKYIEYKKFFRKYALAINLLYLLDRKIIKTKRHSLYLEDILVLYERNKNKKSDQRFARISRNIYIKDTTCYDIGYRFITKMNGNENNRKYTART